MRISLKKKQNKNTHLVLPEGVKPSSKGCKYQSINKFGVAALSIAVVFIIVMFVLFFHFEKKIGENQLLKDGTALCHLIADVAGLLL